MHPRVIKIKSYISHRNICAIENASAISSQLVRPSTAADGSLLRPLKPCPAEYLEVFLKNIV